MSSIPNLATLRTGRRGPRLRRGGRTGPGDVNDVEQNEADIEQGRDKVVQQTDFDASSSRMSAVSLGYLNDPYAALLFNPEQEAPRRYPIINRGTFVRTTAIDHLVREFLACGGPNQSKQIVSLGAGSDTRFFRFASEALEHPSTTVHYHELDFEANVQHKRSATRLSSKLSETIRVAEKKGWHYHLHALDLRSLISKSPPPIPHLDLEIPTLILSECCLCYLPPDAAASVLQYFTMNLTEPLSLVLYEPIRPFDAFGKTMVTNLASRGIHLQTLQRYASLDAQRQRLRLAGFNQGQGARGVYQLWGDDAWVAAAERERVEKLEWLDEIEEWKLLASHYCVAWGWRGELLDQAFGNVRGSRTPEEAVDEID